MRHPKRKHWTIWSLLVLLSVTSAIQAYPADPDNAALLYYQAFISLPKEGGGDLRIPMGTDPNDQVRKYLAQCQPAIELAVAASKVEHCDWGPRYSAGPHMSMAFLAQCRGMVFLLRADAASLAADEHYRPALERCLVIGKMGLHVGDEDLTSFLSNGAINVVANKTIREILGLMQVDEPTLLWLQQQLAMMSGKEPSLSHALQNEKEFILNKLAEEDVDLLIEAMTEGLSNGPSSEWVDQIKKADTSFFVGSRRYFENHIQKMQAILESPALLVDKLAQLEGLRKRPNKDAQDKPHAIVTAAWMPAIQRILFLGSRSMAGRKLHEAAIEIYLQAVRSGSVPTELPAGLPKDPFTGKDFAYQKTEEGFKLTRWTEDSSDWRHQLEFKLRQ
jgi:hypothetical protein